MRWRTDYERADPAYDGRQDPAAPPAIEDGWQTATGAWLAGADGTGRNRTPSRGPIAQLIRLAKRIFA